MIAWQSCSRGTAWLLLLTLILLPAVSAAQEKSFSLSFTKEVLYNIARDSQGDKTGEIVDRMIGLSPGVKDVKIWRTGNKIALIYTAAIEGDLELDFTFSLDRMAYYRMATARSDTEGMMGILGDVKAREPLILAIGYRFNDRYSIVDLVLDIRPLLKAREEAAMKKSAAQFAPPPSKKTPPREKKAADPKETIKKAETAPSKKEPVKAEAPPKKPKPPPPPKKKEPVYLTAKALGAGPPPTLDGSSGDLQWDKAKPFSFKVKGASGNVTVSMSALTAEDRLYLLVSWPDPDRNDQHRPWVWEKETGEYTASRRIEDGLAIQFSKGGTFSACMLAGQEAVLDLWYWRAGRTNPMGYAEDETLTMSFRRIPQANFYQSKNNRTVWIKEIRDTGTRPFRSQVAGEYTEDVVPRYIPRAPEGSVADVRAAGLWRDGVWTVELERKYDTGDPVDVRFGKGRDHYFSVAVFNGRDRSEHSSSGELLLRLE